MELSPRNPYIYQVSCFSLLAEALHYSHTYVHIHTHSLASKSRCSHAKYVTSFWGSWGKVVLCSRSSCLNGWRGRWQLYCVSTDNGNGSNSVAVRQCGLWASPHAELSMCTTRFYCVQMYYHMCNCSITLDAQCTRFGSLLSLPYIVYAAVRTVCCVLLLQPVIRRPFSMTAAVCCRLGHKWKLSRVTPREPGGFMRRAAPSAPGEASLRLHFVLTMSTLGLHCLYTL